MYGSDTFEPFASTLNVAKDPTFSCDRFFSGWQLLYMLWGKSGKGPKKNRVRKFKQYKNVQYVLRSGGILIPLLEFDARVLHEAVCCNCSRDFGLEKPAR